MTEKLAKILRAHYAVFAYLTIFFLIFAYKLVASPVPFYDWDESIYAQVANEMMNKPSLVPLWQGTYWLDKPPLVPLVYGIIFKITPFIQQEISGRLTTLILTIIALGLVYKLYFKVIKEQFLTTAIVILTSVSPIFLQRSQVLNIDVFLLIGWIGYVLFFDSFWWSLCFLAIAVLSKTLVGFYPAGIMLLYQLFLYLTHQINQTQFTSSLKKIIIHISILSTWYIAMFIFFGKAFWIQHIYETHFKRVSASIESHFGQRTYYIDLLFEQLAGAPLFLGSRTVQSILYALLIGMGFFIIIYRYFRKILNNKQLLNSSFILPWFMFLNIAKTKIFWYAYPYITQFALLLLYPVTLLRRWKIIYYTVTCLLILIIINYYFVQKNILAAQFSQYEDHQILATYAKNICNKLIVLVGPNARKDNETLAKMGLTITTTTWWGEHPSMVYYFGKNIEFVYKTDNFATLIQSANNSTCFVMDKKDINMKKELKDIQTFGELHLMKIEK